MSNQERISPHNINKILSRQVMRIKKNIIQGITWWIQYPILKTNVLRIVEQTGLFYFAKQNDMKQNQARYNETKGIMKKDVFCHFMSRGTKKKFQVPMRNQTSDLQIPHSNALPLSHRDSMGERGLLQSSYNTHPAYC